MERKTVDVRTFEIDKCLLENELFSWKEESREINGERISISFIRDENIKNLEEIKKLEKEYNKVSKIPSWLVILLSALAFGLITTFVIFNFFIKNLISMPICIGAFLVPGCIFILVSAVCSILNNKQMMKYEENFKNRYSFYKEKVDGLK